MIEKDDISSELIFDDKRRELVIRSQKVVSPEMLDLIGRTAFGNGGTQYFVCDVADKLSPRVAAHFISLRKHGRLIGSYVLIAKMICIDEQQYPAYYRTLLALEASERGRGYGKLLVERTRAHFLQKLGTAGLLYGYIEADNHRSLSVAEQAGYESLGTFETPIFSRMSPRDDSCARQLLEEERAAMVDLLGEQYKGHALIDFAQSVDVMNYFVLEENHTIVAGVQVEPCYWCIRRLSGVSGFLLVHIVSRVPGLRRIFDAQHCRFLRLGSLYVQPGQEPALIRLIEAMLARNRVSSAMTFQDPRSSVYQRVARYGRFGILHSGVGAKVHVMATFKGASNVQHERYRQMPLLISPMDIA